ncbi:MAG: antibiotic biosynthesis monooxygenase [Frankia sp.]
MSTLPWTGSTMVPSPGTTPTAASAGAAAITTAGPSADPAGVVVMASSFRLRSRRDTVRMLRAALRVRRQVLTSPGALGVSLIARPLRREYLTLSAWSDRVSLDTFVGTSPHREAMRGLRPAMAGAVFTFWSAPSGQPPRWADAREHLAAEERRRAAGDGTGDGPTGPGD